MPLPPCLVLSAGLGTRSRPLSRLRAKPAFPVSGVPLIRRILGRLAAAGVRRAVLNLHHLGETVRAAVGDPAELGMEVSYSWEDPVLGSAGGPRRALSLLASARALLVNGDTLTGTNLRALHAAHDECGALVTLALIPNPAPQRYGGVLLGEAGAVTRFVPRGWPEPTWHFIGVQAVETSIFADLPPDQPFESVGWLYPELMSKFPGSVRGFTSSAEFMDIGTPGDYLATCLQMAAGNDGALRGPGCRVDRTALVARSVLWEDVQVRPRAHLEECIVTDGAVVPQDSSFVRRILVPRSRAGSVAADPGASRVGDLVVFPLDERNEVR